MKPHVICHMAASLDGRTLSSRWRPDGAAAGGLFERLHEELVGDAWLVGRVTGQEFAKGKAYPARTDKAFPREAWFARRDAKAYGIVLDAHGKIAWGRSDIGGDQLWSSCRSGSLTRIWPDFATRAFPTSSPARPNWISAWPWTS